MSYCGYSFNIGKCTLADAVYKGRKFLNNKFLAGALMSLAVKLHQVHTLGLIHGDVKADNIAIINLDPVQVTPLDYGLCVPLCSAKRSKRTGGVQYDPKLLAGDIAKCPETDIYSIGILSEYSGSPPDPRPMDGLFFHADPQRPHHATFCYVCC